MAKRALVVGNGDLPRKSIGLAEIDRAEFVVAADGGMDRMIAAYGRAPDAVLGDFDSLAGAVPTGTAVLPAPDQNATDLDKAIRHLQGLGYDDICVIGATGDRLDHTFGAIRAVCLHGVRLVDNVGTAARVQGPGSSNFATAAGRTISLMPCGSVDGLTTRGLKWELSGVRFDFPECDGTSNAALGEQVRIDVGTGTIVVYVHHGDA